MFKLLTLHKFAILNMADFPACGNELSFDKFPMLKVTLLNLAVRKSYNAIPTM